MAYSENTNQEPRLPTVSERELKALRALAECAGGDYGYLPFRSIAVNSGLDLKHVRRTVRALARKGLAEYGSGLCTEDGDFAGSGYRCTHDGVVLVERIWEDSQPRSCGREG